jgi:hypothetical protein
MTDAALPTPREIRRILRKHLPPGARVVAGAPAAGLNHDGSWRHRYRFEVPLGVDPLAAQAALAAALAEIYAKIGIEFARPPSGRLLASWAEPFVAPEPVR